MESLTEWALWAAYEVFQGLLGSIWVGMMLMFIMFFYNYRKNYNDWKYNKDKSAYLTYLDLEKVKKKIGTAFLMYLVATYFITFVQGFPAVVTKGAIFSLIVFPPIYLHYSDERKYRFDLVKGD